MVTRTTIPKRTSLERLRVERASRRLEGLGDDGGHALEDDRGKALQVIEDLEGRPQLRLWLEDKQQKKYEREIARVRARQSSLQRRGLEPGLAHYGGHRRTGFMLLSAPWRLRCAACRSALPSAAT